MSTEDELNRLRRLNRQLIELLESRGIDWPAELDPGVNTRLDRAANFTATSTTTTTTTAAPGTSAASENTTTFTTHQKIALFRKLFRGRTDVYPVRWENNAGRSGYSPACFNEWKPGICGKPAIKCSQCPNQAWQPVTDQVIYDHLAGKHVVGVYPMIGSDQCHFLAVDFDEGNWQADAAAFRQSCEELNIPCAVEISRSGNGAHAWIFFSEPTLAKQARNLGAAIISYTCAGTGPHHRQLQLSSYDRMFPNQDSVPKGLRFTAGTGTALGTDAANSPNDGPAAIPDTGLATAAVTAFATTPAAGLGNLIALPLQKYPRTKGHSVFVDRDFVPHPDQWAYLASIKPLIAPDNATENGSLANHIEDLIQQAVGHGNALDVGHFTLEAFDPDAPWQRQTKPKHTDSGCGAPPSSKTITLTLSNLIYLPKAELSAQLTNRLIRIAAFQNPEYYKAQALRLSVWNKPRVIACAENFPNHIGLPRGCLDAVIELLSEYNIQGKIQEERQRGKSLIAGIEDEAVTPPSQNAAYSKSPIANGHRTNPAPVIQFHGKLRPEQTKAVKAMLAHDHGVLCAPTAFGKTVTAAALIAERGVNTLILVHRTELLEQWKERLCGFLGLAASEVGVIGGGKNATTRMAKTKKATTKSTKLADARLETSSAALSSSGGQKKPASQANQLPDSLPQPKPDQETLIDIAMVQSLARQGNVNPVIERYGHVIVDECHHVSAVSFEQILKTVKAKYVLGLTATPIRRDGLQPIIMMQCGPIRHRASRSLTATASLTVHAYEVDTPENWDEGVISGKDAGESARSTMDNTLPIQKVFQSLAQDEARIELIVNQAMVQFHQGRKLLLLTERTDHLLAMQAMLQTKLRPPQPPLAEAAEPADLLILHGRMKKSERSATLQRLQSLPPDQPRILLATGKLIGEGFDHAPLDTLILAMPISWKGTLQQYVGRLHREHDGKTDILVIDFIDRFPSSLLRMWKKRQAGYKAMGYRIVAMSTKPELSAESNPNLQLDLANRGQTPNGGL